MPGPRPGKDSSHAIDRDNRVDQALRARGPTTRLAASDAKSHPSG